MNVEWKKVPGYDNYIVSNMGEIKSLRRKRVLQERILKPIFTKGDAFVYLFKDGESKCKSLKKIVAKVFMGYDHRKHKVSRVINNVRDSSVANLKIDEVTCGLEAFNSTPIDILLNFPSTYLAKKYNLDTTTVHRILSRKIDDKLENASFKEVDNPFVAIEEFESYYSLNQSDIDGAWMNGQFRSESKKCK